MLRVALICDPVEERWPSMDLVADMLYSCLKRGHPDLEVTQLRPPMRPHLSRFRENKNGRARSAQRLFHRYLAYPAWLHRRSRDYDVFHVVDHSYAQLVHEIPPQRTVVSCHDLDAFRCVLEPNREKRSLPFRLMTKRVLSGLSKASAILCDSNTIRDELLGHSLVPPERVNVVLHGTHPSCKRTPDPLADVELDRLLGSAKDSSYLLHVGSTVPRKRLDTLLQVFAGVRKSFPNLKLVRVGGPFTPAQEELAMNLEIREAIHVLPHIDRPTLAAVYRRADLLLLTSDAEGFGLPLIEAMACGCPVVASDIPVLREIGGTAAIFCPVADVGAWVETITGLFVQRRNSPNAWQERRDEAAVNASHYTWENSAAQCVDIYKRLLRTGDIKQ